MADRALLYYITDRSGFPGDESERRRLLLEKIAEASRCGVDYIQLREKDLPARELERLAHDALTVVRSASPGAALLINSRTDIALAVGADGVHLRSDDISPADVRRIWECGAGAPSISSGQAPARADFAVFAPVFEKKDSRPAGLAALKAACGFGVPVLALGGVKVENAQSCLDAGAAGIAAIRLFQEHDVAQVVRTIRG